MRTAEGKQNLQLFSFLLFELLLQKFFFQLLPINDPHLYTIDSLPYTLLQPVCIACRMLNCSRFSVHANACALLGYLFPVYIKQVYKGVKDVESMWVRQLLIF